MSEDLGPIYEAQRKADIRRAEEWSEEDVETHKPLTEDETLALYVARRRAGKSISEALGGLPVVTEGGKIIEAPLDKSVKKQRYSIDECTPENTTINREGPVIIGRCNTTENFPDGSSRRRTLEKTFTIPEDNLQCVSNLYEKHPESDAKQQVEIALGCMPSGMTPSQTAKVAELDLETTEDAIVDLITEDKIPSVKGDEKQLTDPSHPYYWFGESIYYLDPKLKREIQREAGLPV